MNRVITSLLELLAFLVILGICAMPVLWLYATVSSCGWKGLFVECRITADR